MGRQDLPPLPSMGHFIGGEYTLSRSRDVFENVAPATGQIFGTIPLGSARDIDDAVQAAKAALAGPWGKMNVRERSVILRRVADILERELDYFAALEAMDTGKPIAETKFGDIPRSIQNFRFFAGFAEHAALASYTADDGSVHRQIREPIGIVGLITPWNLPLYLATWKIAPALVQGNAVILKPAEWTPLTAMALGAICTEAGLPPGVLSIVQGFGKGGAGEALVAHPDVKAISFTGETNTGRAIMANAAPHLKKLSFELGGKGATIIEPDADLESAAKEAVRAAFRNQGQICLAGSRLLIHENVHDEVLERVKDHVRALKIGHPLDDATTLASLVHIKHREKVHAFVEEARADLNLKVETLGAIPQEFKHGAYFPPTLVIGPSQKANIIQHEVFGPVLTVQRYSSVDEGIAMVNDTTYGLSASVWTKDTQKAAHMARHIRAGLVWTNCWFKRDLHTAFGGMKASGIGREGGTYSLDFFSELKTITTA